MVPIYHWLYKTPAVQKYRSGVLSDDWNLHVGVIQLRAMQYAKKYGLKLIIGHTHSPAPFNGLVADGGDMVDSFSYITIEDDEVEDGFFWILSS
jgi:hypothetical protein